MGVLGSGHNEAFIYDRGGTKRIAPIENARSLEWNRTLNSISEASVSVLTGSHGDCCSVLGNIGTWGHSLVMFRDGVRSWEGPITNIEWTRGGVNIGAHDVLGWSIKRPVYSAILVPVADWVVDQLTDDINRIFSGHDPNILAHLQTLGAGTGPQTTRDVKIYGGYYDDQLNELVKAGGMYTTVGRRIMVWPSTTIIGKTSALIPFDHMTGDVSIQENGMDLAMRVVAVNDAGLWQQHPAGVDPFYGFVGELLAIEATDNPTLLAAATQWYESHYPAPLSINVPAGSVLSCDAPFSMEELVPGTLIPVKIDRDLCKQMTATQQLTEVKVTDGPKGEKVAITVAPVSGVLT